MALSQIKFPADIGTGSTQYRYITFSIGAVQETAQDKLTEYASKTLENAKNIGSNFADWLAQNSDQNQQEMISAVKGAFGSDNVNLTGAIMLPLPNAMEDTQQHRWEEQEGLTRKIGEFFTKKLNNVAGKMPLMDVDAEYAMKYLNMSAKTRQFTTNPSYWQMYKGSTPRGITFTWAFVPRTSAEASLIQDVIVTFKKFASPEKLNGGFLFKSPYVWTVTFSNPKITNMLALKKLVCNQVQVSYGEGAMSLFKDGMPKYVQLSVSFQECTVSTAEDYNSSIGTSSTSQSASNVGASLENAVNTATGSASVPSASSATSAVSTIVNSTVGKFKS